MKKSVPVISVLILILTLFFGCMATIPQAPNAVNRMVYQKDFEKVWSTVLIVFQKHNIEISEIEKESGIIVGISDREAPMGDFLMDIRYRNRVSVLVSKVSAKKTQVSIKNIVESMQKVAGGTQWRVYKDMSGKSRDTKREMFLYEEIGSSIQL